jgi:hypothetical protein
MVQLSQQLSESQQHVMLQGDPGCCLWSARTCTCISLFCPMGRRQASLFCVGVSAAWHVQGTLCPTRYCVTVQAQVWTGALRFLWPSILVAEQEVQGVQMWDV